MNLSLSLNLTQNHSWNAQTRNQNVLSVETRSRNVQSRNQNVQNRNHHFLVPWRMIPPS